VNKVENDDPSLQEPVAGPEAAPGSKGGSGPKPRSGKGDGQGSLF
jgi:hypothetical protein